MMRFVLFVVVSVFFVAFSWRSLKNPGTHGFYRFFVFEGVLLLVLANHPFWFVDPFSFLHIVSWLLLLTSICFVVQSVLMLKQRGGHAEREDMPENHSFENTVTLVEEGLYRYVRHPMYSSLLFLGWGACLKHITPITSGLALAVTGFLVVAARIEEQENLCFFGDLYAEYMRRTRMFVPWVF